MHLLVVREVFEFVISALGTLKYITTASVLILVFNNCITCFSKMHSLKI